MVFSLIHGGQKPFFLRFPDPRVSRVAIDADNRLEGDHFFLSFAMGL